MSILVSLLIASVVTTAMSIIGLFTVNQTKHIGLCVMGVGVSLTISVALCLIIFIIKVSGIA